MTTQKRLRPKDLPIARAKLTKHQNNVCPLCLGKLGATKKQPVLDHDHVTGYIRDVLCRNCNGIEGKVFNLARRAKHSLTEVQWLERLIEYHKKHATPNHGGFLHPTHKTEAEKRLLINKRARDKRRKKRENKK